MGRFLRISDYTTTHHRRHCEEAMSALVTTSQCRRGNPVNLMPRRAASAFLLNKECDCVAHFLYPLDCHASLRPTDVMPPLARNDAALEYFYQHFNFTASAERCVDGLTLNF